MLPTSSSCSEVELHQFVDVAALKLGDGPIVEVIGRLRILPGAGIVGHTAAGDDDHALRASCDDTGDFLADFGATLRRRQRRKVGVQEDRHDGDIAVGDDPFVDGGEAMAQQRVLRVRHVEFGGHQLVEDVLGQREVHLHVVALGREVSLGGFTGDDREGRNRRQEEGFEVVATDDDDGVGLEFVKVPADELHRFDVGIHLLWNFCRRPHEQLRRVNGCVGSYDLSHNFQLYPRRS